MATMRVKGPRGLYQSISAARPGTPSAGRVDMTKTANVTVAPKTSALGRGAMAAQGMRGVGMTKMPETGSAPR